MKSFKHLFCLMLALTCFCSFGIASAADELVYRDINGQWTTFDRLANPGYDESMPHDVVYHPATDNFAFTVTYQDVINSTGFGFDDATQGAARRARVIDALTYISGVLAGETGHADIHFSLSANNPGDPTLASCGALFWTSPDGFQGGLMYEHITTGIDPAAGNPDAVAQVNFGYNWYAGTGTPGGTQYDLLSVLIHEVTHALGYTSAITYGTGVSEINGTNPGVYTFFDAFLSNGNGQAFCSTSGGASFVGNPVNDLLGMNNGVRFTGPDAYAEYGGYVPIYAPSPWEQGSSVSHWAGSVPVAAIMLPSYSAGQVKRTYLDFEVASLADLGYNLGVNTDVPATGPLGIALLLGLVSICLGISRNKLR